MLPFGSYVAQLCHGETTSPTYAPTKTRPDGDTADRKSTRLNSSHLVISYAVFCLKKKKKKVRRSSMQYHKQRNRRRLYSRQGIQRHSSRYAPCLAQSIDSSTDNACTC